MLDLNIKRAPVKGLLRVHPSNPLYFTDDSGKAIHLAGHQIFWDLADHHCGHKYTYGHKKTLDWDWYLDFAEEHNFNYLRNWAEFSIGRGPGTADPDRCSTPQVYARTGPGNAVDGRPKFDLNTFNQDYFDRMRKRFAEAGDRGIYVSIMLFDVFNFSKGNRVPPYTRWDGNVFNPANNIQGINADENGDGSGLDFFYTDCPAILDLQNAYVRKVIDTVSDLDNVFYEIANELYAPLWQTNMINFIKSYEAGKINQHLILRSAGGMDSSDKWTSADRNELTGSPADVFSIDQHWPGHDGSDVPANRDAKPGIWDNDHVWPFMDWRFHKYVWQAFTRGYHYNLYDEPFENPDSESAEIDRTRYNVGATAAYAQKADLSGMKPMNELSDTTYCLACPGKEYIIFQPDAPAPFTVSGLTAGQPYYYEWFDTYSLAVTATGCITPACQVHMFYPSYENAVL